MSFQNDVTAFHLKFGHPVSIRPRSLDPETLRFRVERIREECEELVEALEQGGMGCVAAEAVDLIYVTLGTLVAMGIPIEPFWREIHLANMAKIPAGEHQKPIKPKGWVKPNPGKILYDLKRTDDIDFSEPELW
jgi:predicted HAD superfamily Cof-like phosphohydrolase